ncbi:uncharacterized protein TA11100 [Theileria annulata]|uniref:Trafficking protein particle complex subunit 11 domain-containing protein n=1 Tax=Theileria annulata TaxID=5874 RepID=Q4U8H0_THEAN|nr:uncharacterized protein TA11100 [Theileria annulata]CAI76883.1 hypothetical protein TA11100 [Theileria annulata]|eukprot:XP_953508.1 hypothetical protein TA11100 [Theileria annulata]
MFTLQEYLLNSPLPCVNFVISDSDQMKIYSLLSSVNKNKGNGKSERFNLRVLDVSEINKPTPKKLNWFQRISREPTCVVYCTDWQNYKVESSKNLNPEAFSDPNLVDILSGTVGIPSNFGKERRNSGKSFETESFVDQNVYRVTSKQLEKLIRDDIDRFLVPMRKINSRKTIPHKFLFLVNLNKSVKNPNKVIGSLKTLDPSEVCAVCVSCGPTDINAKLEKLEQMIYETSISYYEKKIKKMSKTIANLKAQITGNLTDITELYLVLLNFKMGYFSELISNRKEAHGKYSTCLSTLKQMDTSISAIDKTSLSFHICLRLLDYLFYSGDFVEYVNVYREFELLIKRLVFDKFRGLYYNLMYSMNYYIGYKLETKSSNSRNSKELLLNSTYYYKWALHFIILLRTEINKSDAGDLDNNGMVYNVPENFNNIFYYEDQDYVNEYEKDNEKNELNVEELRVLDKKFESETVKLVMKIFSIYKGFNYSSHLLYIYDTLGDSFFLHGNYKEAFNIYLSIAKHIVYNINFNETYSSVVNKYSKIIPNDLDGSNELKSDWDEVDESVGTLENTKTDEVVINKSTDVDEIDYVEVINMFMYSELSYESLFPGLFIKVLSKFILSLANMLDIGEFPEILLKLSNLPIAKYNSKNQLIANASDMAVYKLVLIKSLITFISIYTEEHDVIDYLNNIINLFSTPKSDQPSEVDNSDKHDDSDGKNGSYERNELEIDMMESYVLLSKNAMSQYAYKFENDLIEVLISFETDIELDLQFYEGFLDTSEGILRFYHEKSEFVPDAFVAYCNNVDTGKLEITRLPNNTRIILIISLPFYTLKRMKINGVVLKSKYLKLLVNAVILTNKYFTNEFTSASVFRDLDRKVRIGNYSSRLITGERKSRYLTHDGDGERILNMIYLSCNNYVSDVVNKELSAMDKAKELKIMNLNMKMKIFVKNMVKKFMVPITIVLLFNHRFRQLYTQYSYQLQVRDCEFYIFGGTDDGFVISKTNVVDFDIEYSLMDLEDVEIKLNSSKSQPNQILYHPTNEQDTVTSSQQVDEEVLNYINIYSSNYDVYVMYGLININNIETQKLTLELFINDKLEYTKNNTENTNSSNNDNLVDNKLDKRTEILNDKLLSLYIKKVDVELRDLVNVNLNYKYYNNSNMMLYIDLVNNSEIVYELVNVNILYNNHVLIANNEGKLYGYRNRIESDQSVNLIYIIKNYQNYQNPEDNAVQVQITKYVRQELKYPFNHMEQFLKCTINKFVKVEGKLDKIQLLLKHRNIVHLGQPFELQAEIINNTNNTIEYVVFLDELEDRMYIISGPLSSNLVALPRSSDKLSWTIIATKCTPFKLPVVRVSNKLDSGPNREIKSEAAQIYVVPRGTPALNPVDLVTESGGRLSPNSQMPKVVKGVNV